MIKIENMKIRTCLLAGFVATAAMTLLAGVAGVLSLSQIESAVVGSTATVNEHVGSQSSQLRYTLSIEHLRDNIKAANTIEDIENIKTQFGQLSDIDSDLTDELRGSFGRFIELRKKEIDLSRQLSERTHTLESRFEDMSKAISSLIDHAASGSKQVAEAVDQRQNTPDDLPKISSDIQTAFGQSKASLTVDALSHQWEISYKNVLLSSDPVYVDQAGKDVKRVYASISNELASLPTDKAEKLKPLMSDTQVELDRLLETRKTYLTVHQETVKENENVAAYIGAFNKMSLVNSEHIGGKINSILTKVTNLAHKYRAILLFTSIAAFGIALIIGIIVPRTIGANIRSVIDGVHVISDGNLTRELQNAGNNEFGQLARGFNGMVRNLRDILAKIQDASGQITASGSKILAATEQQAAGTREQSAAVSQTTSAASELSKTSEQIGTNVKAVSKMAKHVLAGMQNIKDATHQTNDILTSLNDKSKQIGNITELIDDIADQTNLLAVNASIEAARAGEQGRGFTVVADQISKLADSTAKSTKDITALIELIQNEMSNAIIAMNESLKGVESEIELAQEAADKAQEIAMSANQQISGSKQIADAMSNIDDTMKQIADSAQMSAASVKELAALADELKDSIKGFKVTENAV